MATITMTRKLYGVQFATGEWSFQKTEERKAYRAKRREAFLLLKAEGFKGTSLDATSKKTAEAYAATWNAKHKFDPMLGPLKVYEYNYLRF